MRIASSGLAFDYEPMKEIATKNPKIMEHYVEQRMSNFALVSYYKSEKKLYAQNEFGFMNIEYKMVFEMNMLDVNPRRFIYDKASDFIFKVISTPINPSLDPSKRRMIQLEVDMINSKDDLMFDLEFIKGKYKELWEALYAVV